MLEEDFCSYEVAKLLKEKGFDEPCYRWYDTKGDVWENFISSDIPLDYSSREYYLCPSQSRAMKWLREVHNYHTEIERNFEYFHNGIMHKPSYDAVVQDIANKDKNYFVAECNTYEEAVEAAIKYCLENLI